MERKSSSKKNDKPKFIFVIGGVLSGLGKGIVTSSVGALLKSGGYSVTAVKIDPYINIDAGTMRPTEHGEVYVTEDGGEIDQDLGNYERFLNIHVPKRNNITTGQIYLSVIEKERQLKYNGRDVEVIPDIVDEVKRRILESTDGNEFTLVEVGGTTGDIENLVFLHAVRELSREYPSVSVMVTYVPYLKNVNELKTKPTQHAMSKLREVGIYPDFVVARSEIGIDKPRRWIIAKRCFVDEEYIIDNPDLDSVYKIPQLFEKQDFGEKILEKFGMFDGIDLSEWKKYTRMLKNAEKELNIALIGKYVSHGKTDHADVYLSVLEAIKHACAHNGVRPKITQIQSTVLEEQSPEEILKGYDCAVIPGGFGDKGIEGIITAIRYLRENDIPLLGLCLGMQLSVIEYARNACGMSGAHSTEMDPKTAYPVIDILPEQKELIKNNRYGATMRLGAYNAILKKGTIVHKLYGKDEVSERHRHRYEVNPAYIEKLESHGLTFSGTSPDGKLMEFMELKDRKFFVATQAHPEFKSGPLNPHPLFMGLIKACLK
ncbi:MAG: CTP synthase [archaeon]